MEATIAITTNEQSKRPYDLGKRGDRNFKNNADILDNNIGTNNKKPRSGMRTAIVLTAGNKEVSSLASGKLRNKKKPRNGEEEL